MRRREGAGGGEKAGDWVEEVCKWERFTEGLQRTTATKGVGCDAWNAYMLRKAPERVQRGYYENLKSMIRAKEFPEEWRERIAMLEMKPGEDPLNLGRRRDLWLECHGSKLTMWLLGAEYEEAAEWTVPASQAGSARGRGAPEQSLMMRCQKEQCAAERRPCCRAYLDCGTFFMSCVREVQWEAERWCGVRAEVTECVQALHASMVGRYETAYGLTDPFDILCGNPQGCAMSPTRSKFQLRMVQEAVRKLCKGFRFRAAGKSIPQMWYVDDGAFMCESLADLQLVMDTCYMVARVVGMQIQIKKDKKTAWQASYWEGNVEREVEGWELRLPDGRVVPQVKDTYKYLGSEERATWAAGQKPVREKVVKVCSQLLRLIGRVGVLGEEQLRIAMGLAVEGVVSYYGRSTAIGWEACEEIERVRAEVLRKRGFVAGTPRVQIHAAVKAGGMGHRHAYQHAIAALSDQFERTITGPEGTPAREALIAHIEATYVRLGWTGRGEMMEWHPTHLEDVLTEEMIVEAWLLGRLRTGVRIRAGVMGARDRAKGHRESRGGERGPPLWEADEREEWRAKETGPCKVRVGIGEDGKTVVRAGPGGRGCEFLAATRRLAASGMRTWGDVTHESGRWLTWEEAREEYGLSGTASEEAYRRMVAELEEERWEGTRERWWNAVRSGEWEKQREEGNDRVGEGKVVGVVAARSTAECWGGYEVLVDWGRGWGQTWEGVRHLLSAGGQRELVKQVQEAREKRWRPASMFERLVGKEGVEAARKGETWEWKEVVRCGRQRMTREEVEEAVRGDVREERVGEALGKMWKLFKEHAYEAGGGKGVAEQMNTAETPEAAAEGNKRREGRRGGDWRRTLYGGEEKVVEEEVEEEGTEPSKEGGKKGKTRRRLVVSLGGETGGYEGVTREDALKRIELDEILHENEDTRAGITPASRPHEWMRWGGPDETGSEEPGVWKGGARGAGYAEIGDVRAMCDPFMRMFLRYDEFEVRGATIRDVNGMGIKLDEREVEVLTKGKGWASAKQNMKVVEVGVPMHVEHVFSDVWATDGSREVRVVNGRVEVRVACGAYKGVQPLRRDECTEDEEDAIKRRIGQGMRGMRLPGCYEVVDAELAGMLMVLKEVAEQPEAEKRKCLIMSDCEGALRMVERAWRVRRAREYVGGDRGAILDAICTYRAKIDLAVFMYVPAHKGVSANAYADAVAKAYLRAEGGEEEMDGMVREGMWEKELVMVVQGAKGAEEVIWDRRAFNVMREAGGWWVQRKEGERIGVGVERKGEGGVSKVVDEGRMGRPWADRRQTRWERVYEATGAREPRERRGEEGGEGGEEEEAGKEIHARLDVTRRRCGVVMAARAGDMWEAPQGKEWNRYLESERSRGEEGAMMRRGEQGCAACCGGKQGWGWWEEKAQRGEEEMETEREERPYRREWRWRGEKREVKAADMSHVFGGRCEAVEGRLGYKRCMREGIARARKAVTRKRKKGRGWVVEEGREQVLGVLDNARAAIAGQATQGWREEKQWGALEAVIAGSLPRVRLCEDERAGRVVERDVIEGVRQVQQAVAGLREGWYEAGKEEVAKRKRREGGRDAKWWKKIGMRVWMHAPQEERPVHRVPVVGEVDEEDDEDLMRVAAAAAREAAGEAEEGQIGEKMVTVPMSVKDILRRRVCKGWTIARALIEYKMIKGKRKESEDRKEGRGGGEESKEGGDGDEGRGGEKRKGEEGGDSEEGGEGGADDGDVSGGDEERGDGESDGETGGEWNEGGAVRKGGQEEGSEWHGQGQRKGRGEDGDEGAAKKRRTRLDEEDEEDAQATRERTDGGGMDDRGEAQKRKRGSGSEAGLEGRGRQRRRDGGADGANTNETEACSGGGNGGEGRPVEEGAEAADEENEDDGSAGSEANRANANESEAGERSRGGSATGRRTTDGTDVGGAGVSENNYYKKKETQGGTGEGVEGVTEAREERQDENCGEADGGVTRGSVTDEANASEKGRGDGERGEAETVLREQREDEAEDEADRIPVSGGAHENTGRAGETDEQTADVTGTGEKRKRIITRKSRGEETGGEGEGAADEEGNGSGRKERPTRKGVKRKGYDETKRRGKREKKMVTMARGAGRPGPLKHLIVLGKRAVDAIAHGREWGDGTHRERRRRRTIVFDDGG